MESLFALPDPDDSEFDGGLSSCATGEIAELKAVVELLQRGHKVARPVVDDDGVDLIVNYRLTVQVKATTSYDPKVGRWRFHTRSGASAGQKPQGRLKLGISADVLLCHSLQDDLWWAIPGSVFGSLSNANITPGSRLNQYRDNWAVFDGG